MEARFRIKHGEVEIEVGGSEGFVSDLLERHLAAWLPVTPPGLPTPPRITSVARATAPEAGEATPLEEFPRVSPSFSPKVNITLGEFADMKQAVSPADLVVVAAYYLEKYGRLETFSPADLQAALAELPAWSCREAVDELELPMTLGHIEALRDGRLTLTFKGQNYVRDGLA